MKKHLIFTNGCFDILHRGHFELLKYCSDLGKVYVGLNSDLSVKRLKGSGRPINNELDRKFALEACRYVDFVEIFEEDTPIKLITKLQPDIIVKGGDYLPEDIIGKEFSQVRIFNYLKGYSTSRIILNASNQKIQSENI